ncbi:MAG: hypothetical protein CVT81_08010 [Alphaproteobacteria bacterium HGW-Alphaproteobacteria-3]|nr:MAG: hypothetical protein CVT81_08010 [Alphaproteobacteria bacterium HGW-Alphaproteobacteria-3]
MRETTPAKKPCQPSLARAGRHRLALGPGIDAKGYRATVLSGVVVAENDEPTGVLPGRLIRGVQMAA